MSPNPYKWQSHSPEEPVERRRLLDDLTTQLLKGCGLVLVGGRGMGKSVVLRQVEARLGARDDVRVVRISGRPPQGTIGACLSDLAQRLGLEPPLTLDAGWMIQALLEREPDLSAVVLLLDEIDQYARPSSTSEPLARMWLNHLESVRRERSDFGVLAAGGLGLYYLKSVFGSTFIGRADWHYLSPFNEAELDLLAGHFERDGRPLSAPVVSALRLASGGIPALATFGLQELWTTEEPSEAAVARTFGSFKRKNRMFLKDVHDAVTHPDLSDVPARVLDLVWSRSGEIARADLNHRPSRRCSPWRWNWWGGTTSSARLSRRLDEPTSKRNILPSRAMPSLR